MSLIRRDTGAASERSAVKMVKRAIESCQRLHMCSVFLGARKPPTRLLAVQKEKVSLVETLKLTDSPRYIALSYCWGGYDGLKLTHATIGDLENGLDHSSLPQTIRHAAELALDLEVPYLWVDSLCILQDDNGAEWQHEAGRMHEICGHAVFTLAASASASTDDGFLRKCITPEFTLSQQYTFDQKDIHVASWSFSDIRARSSLVKRGWIFQEELLSPRIVYWSEHGVFWFCMGNKCSNSNADLSMGSFNPQMFWTYHFPLDLWRDSTFSLNISS